MKKMKLVSLLSVFAFVIASCGGGTKENAAEISEALEPGEKPENAVVMTVNEQNSTINWRGEKVTGEGHYGTIGLSEGELYLVNDQIVGGSMVIDMEEIIVEDITDAESNAKLVGHLKSDDFFSVSTYPEATFEMAQIKKIEDAAPGEPNYTISGNLTIKGITHGLTFPATVEVNEDNLTAKANFSFDRALYEVRFGSGSFFDDLGDNMIRDEIELDLELYAM